MIVKDSISTSRSTSKRSRWLIWALTGSVVLLLAGRFVFKQFDRYQQQEAPLRAYCDAESTERHENETKFLTKGIYFRNGKSQSSEKARSGRYASRLDEEHRFGMLYDIPDPQPGDRYRVSVWRYGNNNPYTYLTVNITGDAPFYRQESEAVQVDEAGWAKIEYVVAIPRGFGNGKASVYIYGGGREGVYFDDLLIEKIPKSEYLEAVLADTTLPAIDLRIDTRQFRQITDKRREAMAQGILVSKEDDWVKAAIMETDSKIPVRLRLKGDWMDHLIDDKWSFRIRTKFPHAWNRMLTFSIQNPRVRDYLNEWVYHQFMKREDVLSTRYDFVRVSINGEAKGIYAYEEHFEKQLPEHQNRREGPVLKLEEVGVWNARKRNMDFHPNVAIEEEFSNFEASQARPFREAKTLGDTVLIRQFRIAQELMHQYKFGTKPISEVFDLEKLARYYAITDLTQGYHSLVWHNQRFYYNPVISKLEPIGYDGFTESGIFQLYNKPFSAHAVSRRSGNLHDDLHINPFLDPVFLRIYVQELDRLSRKSYIENLLLDLEPTLRARERALQQEYPNYNYQEIISNRAKQIRSLLFPLNQDGIQAHVQETSPSGMRLSLANYHSLALEVVGFGKNASTPDTRLDTALWIGAYEKGSVVKPVEQEVAPGMQYVFYRLPGLDSLYRSEISEWKRPGEGAPPPAQALFNGVSLQNTAYWSVSDSVVQFYSGKFTVDHDLLIPAGYTVRFPADLELNLVRHARFVSRSPVQMMGEADRPIRIYSADQSANGFTILQAEGLSRMHYVRFEDLNTFSYRGWVLTGAVTAYESDIEIDHCAFLKAHCEDGLNLVRSTFSLRNSLVSQTFSDGFDADFCQGIVEKTRFEHTGNDGMDLSGSLIKVHDCYFNQTGDKGISVGERAEVTVSYAEIDGAVIGLASKDLSFLHVQNLKLANCQTGFAAYQKKPEYGGGRLWVDRFSEQNIHHLHLAEQGSEIKLRGEVVEGI